MSTVAPITLDLTGGDAPGSTIDAWERLDAAFALARADAATDDGATAGEATFAEQATGDAALDVLPAETR